MQMPPCPPWPLLPSLQYLPLLIVPYIFTYYMIMAVLLYRQAVTEHLLWVNSPALHYSKDPNYINPPIPHQNTQKTILSTSYVSHNLKHISVACF